jgi:hypothetical protein
MFRYFRAMINWVKGWFGAGADSLAENQHVMGATYDAAIKKRDARFGIVKNAVAELLGIEQDRKVQLKELGARIEKLKTVKLGAQTAMQKRIDALKGTKTKQEMLADPEFIKHKAAYDDASSTLTEVQERFDEKDADLKTKQKKIAEYKAELQGMQRANEALREEKQEAIADVGIAKQDEAINSLLNGIPQDTADADLQKAREARKRVVNRAAVTSEIAGNDAKHAENEYLAMAAQAQSTNELDKLLDFGDGPEKTEDAAAPAKLPE